ncbi:MAG TPA: DUF2171 domain-containing protein [Ktedonobacteraceae bacterium]|jgi:hypothetical protein|nr:DUF2171 domain-containing protein [Ktedonobacteraceae bacterium]
MKAWTQNDVRTHMAVHDSADNDLGHVEEIYEDSFLMRKGLIFHHDRYIPYSAIARIDNEHVYLLMSKDEVNDKEWNKRPDYEDHEADPTQLLYDRGHGVTDPFDEINPNHT